MSFFQKITRGRIKKPLFMVLYSSGGVGKTQVGHSFPDPFFYDFEESTHNIDVKRHRPTDFEEVLTDLQEVLDEKEITDFKSIIFDTVDELERLIHKHVAKDKKKNSIEDIGWQKGYDIAITYWAELISLCRQIRDKHKIHFCFLAHSFDRSSTYIENGESYLRHSMALHKKAADFLFAQVEMVLFAKKDIAIKIKDDRAIVRDLETRKVYTNLSAHYDAKNRVGLPPEMPMPYFDGVGNNRGLFHVVYDAYNKAFTETPEVVLKECLDQIPNVQDEALREQMSSFVESNKTDLSVLRATLVKINSYIKGSTK